MHVIIGGTIVVASFALAFQYASDEFDGFYNVYSLILLIGVPIGLAIVTHPFSAILDALRGIGLALSRDLSAQHRDTERRLLELARASLSGRGRDALEAIGGSKDAVLVALGERVVRRDSTQDLEADGLVLSSRQLRLYEAAENFFGSLGEYAPGIGMIGTVIGLVQLLANMGDLNRLGPAMAIALLTTFYGLVLSHALYLPLSRLAATHGERRAKDLRVMLSALSKIAAQRPMHEIELVVAAGEESRSPAPSTSRARS